MNANSDNSLILVTNRSGLRIITINNPKKKNALSRDGYKAITAALNKAAEDNTVKLVALTGTGDFFSSGNDVKMKYPSTGNLETDLILGEKFLCEFIHTIMRFPKLLIAVVNGPAIGIGATILPLCDVVYASETAYFLTPFVRLEICSEACSSYTFPKILGKSKASEMLLLNHKLTADEALKFKFVSEIFTATELDAKIWPKIEKLTELSTESIMASKKLGLQMDQHILEKACENECKELRQLKFKKETKNTGNKQSKL